MIYVWNYVRWSVVDSGRKRRTQTTEQKMHTHHLTPTPALHAGVNLASYVGGSYQLMRLRNQSAMSQDNAQTNSTVAALQ